jgi:hypothetical protein
LAMTSHLPEARLAALRMRQSAAALLDKLRPIGSQVASCRAPGCKNIRFLTVSFIQNIGTIPRPASFLKSAG